MTETRPPISVKRAGLPIRLAVPIRELCTYRVFVIVIAVIDLDRLREALDRLRKALEWYGDPGSYTSHAHALVTAAHRYLYLVETGRQVDWCETHDSQKLTGDRCGISYYKRVAHNDWGFNDHCRFVPMWLVEQTV